MDYKLVTAALAVLCLILAAYIIVAPKAGVGGQSTVYVNNTVYPKDDLRVYYLYPLRCVECDLTKPGQCDYCTSYYDVRLMDMISQEVGVPVEFKVSDVVSKPAVFVVTKDKSTLGDARTRFNIDNTVCGLAGVKAACDAFKANLDAMRACVTRAGLPVNGLVYQTSSQDCPVCKNVDGIASQLGALSYNDTVEYSVKIVDRADDSQRKLISDCFGAFDKQDYAPQLLCPATGKDLTGEFTLSQAQAFADRCIEAG